MGHFKTLHTQKRSSLNIRSKAMSNQPNTTLYINNLNDQVNKDELRSQLFALFTTYGKIIDVIASKGPKKRGQAFLVFTDLAGATSALRACEGMVFYDKPMVSKITSYFGYEYLCVQHIDYAKSKSYATLRREDPLFVPPNSVHAHSGAIQNGRITISSDKRQRDDDTEDGERQSKREKADEDDEEEMEIDEDEESALPSASTLTSGTSLYLHCQYILVLRHFTGRLRACCFGATIGTVTMHKPATRSVK